jgi:tellurite resistance protein
MSDHRMVGDPCRAVFPQHLQETRMKPFHPYARRVRPPALIVPGVQSGTLDAIAAAAALVALSDGAVHRRERRAWLRVLRRQDLLVRVGRGAARLAFERQLAAATPDPAGLCEAAECLRKLAGTPLAPLAAAAAAETVLADGIAWPQELAMMQVVLERLELRGLAE